MGGEGSMQAMTTILKNNRSLLKSRKIFDEKSKIKNYRTKLKFNEISQEKLEQIKKDIRKNARKKEINYRLIFISITILVGIMFYFILKDFYINFNLFFRQV